MACLLLCQFFSGWCDLRVFPLNQTRFRSWGRQCSRDTRSRLSQCCNNNNNNNNGLTLIPWLESSAHGTSQGLTTLAESYLASTSAGLEERQRQHGQEGAEYMTLMAHIILFTGIETLGPINKGLHFLSDLGPVNRIHGWPAREIFSFFSALSIIIQRYNSICFQGSFIHPADNDTDYAIPAFSF